MLPIDKHSGRDYLNSDDAVHIVQPTEYINLENFRVGTADGQLSRIGFWESIGGTLLKANTNLPGTGTNIQLGKAEDIPNRRIIYFIQNSLGNDAIFCYDEKANIIYTVLLSSQITGGFNFSKDHPIHSAFVLNGCVYWTDNFNQPRRIDIDAGIKLNQPLYVTTKAPYTSPLDISVISWIRRAPGLPPTETKVIQTVPAITTNFLNNDAYQFSYRYWYRNYEFGKLGPYSTLCNFNAPTDMFNRVDITIPFGEYIQQDVIQIDLVAKYMLSGDYFVINSWQTSVPADAAAIAAHNAGTTPLSFSFYNDKLLVALDTLDAATPYDSVPLLTETVERAKNRTFMGNYTAGYNTPTGAATSSLAILPVQESASTTVLGLWILFKFHSDCGGFGSDLTLYLIDISNIPDADNPGYYLYVPGGVPPYPPSVAWAQCDFRGAGLFDVMNYYSPGCINTITQFTNTGSSSVVTGAPTPPALVAKTAFKSDSPYEVAVTFYDYWRRKCGVLTNAGFKFSIPERTYSQVNYTTLVNWTLSNANALTEIPDWAYYYSLDLTNNLRTRYFLQARAKSVVYATVDPTDGTYVFTSTTYVATAAGVGIDISLLDSQGMGYVFNQGDILKLYTLAGNEYLFSIVAQQGSWLVCGPLQNVLIVGGFKALFEIYVPYKSQPDEPFYEVAETFPVNNPGTPGRLYSVIAGSFTGDITLLNRNDGTQDYLTENMNPNDKFYKRWFTNGGQPNYIDTIGQQTKQGDIAFSDTFIAGSKINGLSTFEALNTYGLPSDYGAIMKLVLTTKVQRSGSIMLAICSGSETGAIYIGENIIQATSGDQTISQASNVIGYVNNLRGSYGTLDPTSVVEFRGNVYWLDALNGKWIQYSDNGLFPVSNYKMTRFWKLFCDQYMSMTKPEIEALGSRPYIFSGIDPHNGELLISIPRVLIAPPLPPFDDYTPAIPNPYDIYDGQAKTIVYKIMADPNKWQGAYTIKAEGFSYINDNVYAFKDGQLWLMNNPGNQCNFFGEQFYPKIMLLMNASPNNVKVAETMSSESNVVPMQVIMRNFEPIEQGTDLLNTDFGEIEGKYFAPLFRDRLTPNNNAGAPFPTYFAALFGGDPMRSAAMYVMVQYDPTLGLVQVKNINFNYNFSVGAQKVAPKT